jgi:hypothetical protein
MENGECRDITSNSITETWLQLMPRSPAQLSHNVRPMNRKKKNRDKEYRPPRWISIFILIATITIPIALICLAGAEFNLTNAFLAALSAIGVIALIELKISKVVIREDEIDIIGLFKKKKILINMIDYVQLEDWEAHIKLIDGGWQHLPKWFSNHKSFYGTLKHRIKNRKT